MHPDGIESTDVTLLGRLRSEPNNPTAWAEFTGRYRHRIYSYCLANRLQPADAEDVTQTVLLKLVGKLREFRYDPELSFRNWLKVVTRNVLCDFHSERQPDLGSGDSALMRLLASVEAREGLVQQLEAEFDQELLELALRHVRTHVPEQQWRAFDLTALRGLSGAQAAVQLDMLVATVYTAKSKVQKLVRDEIRRLEERNGQIGKKG